jgi:hypothetical protein
MGERARIGVGLAVFLLLAGYPVWSAFASSADPGRPELARAVDSSGCVEDTTLMKATHPQILNAWRNAVVREGERTWTSSTGREWEMSLTGTCLECHDNSADFCTRCHDWADVKPTCWSCHVVPEGTPAGDGDGGAGS